MYLGLNGRVALVAAGSRGIGAAVARELAGEGATVYLCGRDEARASETATRIARETGSRCVAVAADVTRQGDVEEFVRRAREDAGPIDVLVTNAGGAPFSTFESTEIEMYRQGFELNALSAIRLAHLVVPEMRERRWGRVVCITSVSVKQPIEGLLLSNTVRTGLTGWAKTVSTEVAADGVTVNCVAPGYTRTERLEAAMEATGLPMEEALARQAATIPIRRHARPEEVAAAVAFLASERASYVTGITLSVDGGWVKSVL